MVSCYNSSSFKFFYLLFLYLRKMRRRINQLRVKIMRVRVGCFEKMEEVIKKVIEECGKANGLDACNRTTGSTNKAHGLMIVNLGVNFNIAFFSGHVQLHRYRHKVENQLLSNFLFYHANMKE